MKERKRIGAALRQAYFSGEDAHGALWDAVIACQGETFHTASGLPFSYTVRRKRDGTYSGELLVTRKEGSQKLGGAGLSAGVPGFRGRRAALLQGPQGHRADLRHLLCLQPVLGLGTDSGAGACCPEAGRGRMIVKPFIRKAVRRSAPLL